MNSRKWTDLQQKISPQSKREALFGVEFVDRLPLFSPPPSLPHLLSVLFIQISALLYPVTILQTWWRPKNCLKKPFSQNRPSRIASFWKRLIRMWKCKRKDEMMFVYALRLFLLSIIIRSSVAWYRYALPGCLQPPVLLLFCTSVALHSRGLLTLQNDHMHFTLIDVHSSYPSSLPTSFRTHIYIPSPTHPPTHPPTHTA